VTAEESAIHDVIVLIAGVIASAGSMRVMLVMVLSVELSKGWSRSKRRLRCVGERVYRAPMLNHTSRYARIAANCDPVRQKPTYPVVSPHMRE
jgi:hypothetical protein